MVSLRQGLLVAVALGAWGCNLEPLDLVGLKCDAARPCPGGLTCVDGACATGTVSRDAGSPDAGGRDAGPVDAGREDAGVPDAGIPFGVNLLANPGFEVVLADGGLDTWRASPGVVKASTEALNGLRCGRVEAVAPALITLFSSSVAGVQPNMTFCARVWVRSLGDAGVDLALQIRERYADGGSDVSSMPRAHVTQAWTELRETYSTIGHSVVDLRLGASFKLDGGDGFLADDAQLTRAPATCP
jgi:hypothetical protein